MEIFLMEMSLLYAFIANMPVEGETYARHYPNWMIDCSFFKALVFFFFCHDTWQIDNRFDVLLLEMNIPLR